MKKFYITTPLYYVNDVPHIGHAYTTIAADVLARWKRLSGVEVFFLTGTDEHGLKIAQAAEAHGQSPQEYADNIAGRFKQLWTKLNISNDDISNNVFIRTTEPRHEKVVQGVFEKLLSRGCIYKGKYEGWYCTPCETYYSDSELVGKNCPVCGRPVEWLAEESYFFRLSAFGIENCMRLFDYCNSVALRPDFRRTEITNFIRSGLKDISVSRTKVKVKWGIEVPSDKAHTVYVWFDALLNYITAAGYDPASGSFSNAELWPCNVHIVGKEIFRFHTVIWPAMLMALDLPLPKSVFAHGWWTVEGQKMSKSLGNVVDPWNIVDEFGVDVLRYFLFRQIPFGGDGDFSMAALRSANNAYLANDFGNLFNRVIALVAKLKEKNGELAATGLFNESFSEIARRMNNAMERLAFQEAIIEGWKIVDAANAYIDEKAPWRLVKENVQVAGEVLGECLEALKFIAVVFSPFMPGICAYVWNLLGSQENIQDCGRKLLADGKWESHSNWPKVTEKISPLFPRK